MQKILLIDYYGMCDKDGKALGHSPKVLEEYRALMGDEYDVGLAASPCLIEDAKGKFCDKHVLKYNIYSENEMSVRKRIRDKLLLLSNINQVLKIGGYDIFWFYKTDFFLFFFLCFIGLKKKKRHTKFMAQIYQADFGRGCLGTVLNWFYKKGMHKFDGITYAQKEMAGMHPNMLYFPDYYYDAEQYKKYEQPQKAEKAVCLGTMNTYKKLDELIGVFRQNGYPLEIKGFFYDKSYYERLRQKLTPNIMLEDTVLTEEEYYKTLAEAKYTVLPYDMRQYKSRTSGVLIESLFVNTIAVAPVQLLRENGIDGVGYENIEELVDPCFWKQAYVFNNSVKKQEFDKQEIERRLKGFMNSL